jgi:hypothetical protein
MPTSSENSRAMRDVAETCAAIIKRETSHPALRRSAREKVDRCSIPEGYRRLAGVEKMLDDQTTRLDAACESAGLEQLARLLPAIGHRLFIVVTEESGVLIWDPFQDPGKATSAVVAFLDPVDSTHQALLRWGGCAVVLLAKATIKREDDREWLDDPDILAAAIATPDGETFWAEKEQEAAFVDFAGQRHQLVPDSRVGLESAVLSAVVYKRDRILKFHEQIGWVSELGPEAKVELHHGGPLPLAKIAAGEVHLAWDSLKGYAVSDLSPGMFVCAKAGCVCWADAPGWSACAVPLPAGASIGEQLRMALKKRYKFVCCAPSGPIKAFCERHGFLPPPVRGR